MLRLHMAWDGETITTQLLLSYLRALRLVNSFQSLPKMRLAVLKHKLQLFRASTVLGAKAYTT